MNIRSTLLLMICVVAALLLGGCEQSTQPPPTGTAPPTLLVPTPDAPPSAEVEAVTLLALRYFWQVMADEAYGVASALFMDVYRGERQWVQPDELALLHGRAPDLFSAEPDFNITHSAPTQPMIYLGGELTLSHGTLTYGGGTLPVVVEIHQLENDVRLSRLHIGDMRLYPLPRGLEAGEFQTIVRQPLDLETPNSPTLLVESSIFLERVRGALYFDGLAWEQEFSCSDTDLNINSTIEALGWDKTAHIESYAAGVDDSWRVNEMRLDGTFEPVGQFASVRHFQALLLVADGGWCLQTLQLDVDPNHALRAFFSHYGQALAFDYDAAIATYYCAGHPNPIEPPSDAPVLFAFEPVDLVAQTVTVNGTRSDVGLFSAEMQFNDSRWCINNLIITDPSQQQ